jgi:hypothetical protein
MINLLTEEAVLELDCHLCYEGNAKPKLVWFSDSQQVAYYTQHPHGGYTQVYFRRGSSFEGTKHSVVKLGFVYSQ